MPNLVKLETVRGTSPAATPAAISRHCLVLASKFCCDAFLWRPFCFLGNASDTACPWDTVTLAPSFHCCWVWPQDAHLCGGVRGPNGNGCEEVLSGCKMNVPLVLFHRHAAEVQLQWKETQSLSHRALAPSLTTAQGL